MTFCAILPADAPRDVWLAERRSGLTSTDASAVAGLNPWATALDVFCEKRGLLPERDVNPAMEWGTRLQDVIAEAYEQHTGRVLDVPPLLVRSEATPWLLSSLDRITIDQERIVEIKTSRTADGWGPAGTDEVPEYHLLQVHHQMLTTGIDIADIAVLIGGSDFRVYTIPRNDALASRLLEIESTFWQDHLTDDPPEPDWEHPATPALLAAIRGYDESSPPQSLDAATAELWAEWQRLGETVKEGRRADERRKTIKARIEHAMEPATVGILPDGSQIIRALRRNHGYQVDPFEYTVLSDHAPKKKGKK